MEDDRVLVIRASAITGAGIAELVNALFELCPPAPEPPSEDDDGLVEFLVYRPRPDARGGFRILRTDRGFRVTGSAPQPDELEAALRAAGAKTGAEVEVDGETLILCDHRGSRRCVRPAAPRPRRACGRRPDQLGADVLLVLVAERPGHKGVVADAETRRHLAELALGRFGEVRLDDHRYTVDFLREAGLDHPYFVLGGDEWESFASWREPDEVRRLARIAVGSRPGFEPPEGDVHVLRIEQRPVSSSEVGPGRGRRVDRRARPTRGRREIERLGLYRGSPPSSGHG